MKKLLRFLSCLLLLSCALGVLCACGGDEGEEIPVGMKIASRAGATYRLYVPTDWNVNNTYGMTSAYYNLSVQSTVTVGEYPIDAALQAKFDADAASTPDGRLSWYWKNECLAAVEKASLSGTLVADGKAEPTTLGELPAQSYLYKSNVRGDVLFFRQVLCERDGVIYVFTFTCHEELYEALNPTVQTMLELFLFSDTAYYPEDYAKVPDADAEAPAGMKLASTDEVAYRFYVPLDWTVDMEQRIFAAVASDRSSVSVVPYMPEVESMSVGQFFEMNRDLMLLTAGEDGFVLLTESLETPPQTKMGERVAYIYDYTYRVGNTTYRYRQVICAYKSMIYSMTYTALPEHFDAHVGEFEQMVNAFTFR